MPVIVWFEPLELCKRMSPQISGIEDGSFAWQTFNSHPYTNVFGPFCSNASVPRAAWGHGQEKKEELQLIIGGD